MTTYRSDKGLVFRDDAGKHHVQPGETFQLVGDQHAPVVEGLGAVEVPTPEPPPPDATVEELRAAAEALGVPVPAKARKADLRAAVDAVTVADGTAVGQPVEGTPV